MQSHFEFTAVPGRSMNSGTLYVITVNSSPCLKAAGFCLGFFFFTVPQIQVLNKDFLSSDRWIFHVMMDHTFANSSSFSLYYSLFHTSNKNIFSALLLLQSILHNFLLVRSFFLVLLTPDISLLQSVGEAGSLLPGSLELLGTCCATVHHLWAKFYLLMQKSSHPHCLQQQLLEGVWI